MSLNSTWSCSKWMIVTQLKWYFFSRGLGSFFFSPSFFASYFYNWVLHNSMSTDVTEETVYQGFVQFKMRKVKRVQGNTYDTIGGCGLEPDDKQSCHHEENRCDLHHSSSSETYKTDNPCSELKSFILVENLTKEKRISWDASLLVGKSNDVFHDVMCNITQASFLFVCV